MTSSWIYPQRNKTERNNKVICYTHNNNSVKISGYIRFQIQRNKFADLIRVSRLDKSPTLTYVLHDARVILRATVDVSQLKLFEAQHTYVWTCTSSIRCKWITSLIARFMGPTCGPSGADRTQVGPMLALWTLLSGIVYIHIVYDTLCDQSYNDSEISHIIFCSDFVTVDSTHISQGYMNGIGTIIRWH